MTTTSTVDIPPCPIPNLEAEWSAFWSSELGRQLGHEHAMTVRRWLELTTAYRSLLSQCLTAMTVPGSTGQTRANPLWDQLFKAESAIARLEVQLGLTPKSLAEIAVAIGEVASLFADRDPAEPEAEDKGPARPSIGEVLGVGSNVSSLDAIRAARELHARRAELAAKPAPAKRARRSKPA